MLEQAREQLLDMPVEASARLIQANAAAMPLSTDAFDSAHTERVLMHVRDPERVMRELVRIVRPGGWVVCVEPDLLGFRVDSGPGVNATPLIRGNAALKTQPGIGLELPRRMIGAGLTAIEITPVTDVERGCPPDVLAFWEIAASQAVQLGFCDEREAAETLSAFAAADLAGTFVSYSTMFVVAGQKPDRS
jgi:SAM-dependent methyltransferase